MGTVAVTPSEQWRSSDGRDGVIAYLVGVPYEFRPKTGELPEVALRVACTECKHVVLLGSAWTYRYSVFLHALSLTLPLRTLCEHRTSRFFEFTKEGLDGG